MWQSTKALVRGIASHWRQSLSGTLLAVVAVVAAIQQWTVPAWAWSILSILLFAWAVLEAFHDVTTERDVAVDQLRDKRNYQDTANTLTRLYDQGVHDLATCAPRGVERNPAYFDAFEQWHSTVKTWNSDVIENMTVLDCSREEISRVWIIDKLHPGMMLSGDGYESAIRLHQTRLDRLWEVIDSYARRSQQVSASR
jgi:hypothetical protein